MTEAIVVEVAEVEAEAGEVGEAPELEEELELVEEPALEVGSEQAETD